MGRGRLDNGAAAAEPNEVEKGEGPWGQGSDGLYSARLEATHERSCEEASGPGQGEAAWCTH